MGFHLQGFTSLNATGTALIKLNAMPDPQANIQNNNVVIGKFNKIIGMYATGTTLRRAQLQEPTLQKPGYPDIIPPYLTLPGANTLVRIGDYLDNPLELVASEQLSVFAYQNSGGNEQDWVLIWLADTVPTTKKGRIFTLKLTGTTTTVANTWTPCPLSFEDNLPAGKYSLVGAKAVSTHAIAFRIASPDFGNRPGGVAAQDISYLPPEEQRFGGLGEWLTFDNTIQLSVEMLTSAADTAETLFVDLIGPA